MLGCQCSGVGAAGSSLASASGWVRVGVCGEEGVLDAVAPVCDVCGRSGAGAAGAGRGTESKFVHFSIWVFQRVVVER
jgi:hypothetical protein